MTTVDHANELNDGTAVTVRAARPDDVTAVRALLVEVVSTLDIYTEAARANEINHYEEEQLAEIAETGIFFVAEDRHGLCGFCFGYDDDGLIWLSWFIVDQRARGRGVGELLIRHFLEVAPDYTHKVWCDTRSNNEVSKAILGRCGFEELITIPRHWYDQEFTLWQKPVR